MRPCLGRQDLGEMLQEILECGISAFTIIAMPISDGDQKRAGKRELGDAVGVAGESLRDRAYAGLSGDLPVCLTGRMDCHPERETV